MNKMNTYQKPRSDEVRLNSRGKVVAGIASVALLAGGVAGIAKGVSEAVHEAKQPHLSHEQLEKNKDILLHAEQIRADVQLGEAARWRSAPKVENPGTDIEPDTNVGHVKAGEVLDIPYAIVVGDEGWIAFERPGSKPQTLEEKAKYLVYANPDLIARQGAKVIMSDETMPVTVTASDEAVDLFTNGEALPTGVESFLLSDTK